MDPNAIAVIEGVVCCKSHIRELDMAGHVVYRKRGITVNLYSATRSELQVIAADSEIDQVEVRHLRWEAAADSKWRPLRRSTAYRRATPKYIQEQKDEDG